MFIEVSSIVPQMSLPTKIYSPQMYIIISSLKLYTMTQNSRKKVTNEMKAKLSCFSFAVEITHANQQYSVPLSGCYSLLKCITENLYPAQN